MLHSNINRMYGSVYDEFNKGMSLGLRIVAVQWLCLNVCLWIAKTVDVCAFRLFKCSRLLIFFRLSEGHI